MLRDVWNPKPKKGTGNQHQTLELIESEKDPTGSAKPPKYKN